MARKYTPADGSVRDPETGWLRTASGGEMGADGDGVVVRNARPSGSVEEVSTRSVRSLLSKELGKCEHCQCPLVLMTPEAFIINMRAVGVEYPGLPGRVLDLADGVRDSGSLSGGAYCDNCMFADAFWAEVFDGVPHVSWMSHD